MSPDIELTERGLSAGSAEEFNAFLKSDAKKQKSVIQRFMLAIDDRINVKSLMKVWRPRLETVVRLMLVATFLDDSFRTVSQFSEHTQRMGEQGYLRWLATASPELVGAIASVALIIGLLAQFLGSLCLIAKLHPDEATKALIGWSLVQPVLYAQLSNFDLVTESLSLIGGLLMVRAHLVSEGAYRSAMTQLLGRLLLPTMYIYQAGLFLFSALTLDETNNFVAWILSLSMFVVNMAILVGLVIGSILVAAGLKSRAIAFLLALVNLGFVFYNHPFFRFIWYKDGEWKYEDNMSIPNVALPKDVSSYGLTDEVLYNLHRYYFFLGLSTSGALLLLAQFGPGEIAMQKNETLLPVVARAQD